MVGMDFRWRGAVGATATRWFATARGLHGGVSGGPQGGGSGLGYAGERERERERGEREWERDCCRYDAGCRRR